MPSPANSNSSLWAVWQASYSPASIHKVVQDHKNDDWSWQSGRNHFQGRLISNSGNWNWRGGWLLFSQGFLKSNKFQLKGKLCFKMCLLRASGCFFQDHAMQRLQAALKMISRCFLKLPVLQWHNKFSSRGNDWLQCIWMQSWQSHRLPSVSGLFQHCKTTG